LTAHATDFLTGKRGVEDDVEKVFRQIQIEDEELTEKAIKLIVEGTRVEKDGGERFIGDFVQRTLPPGHVRCSLATPLVRIPESVEIHFGQLKVKQFDEPKADREYSGKELPSSVKMLTMFKAVYEESGLESRHIDDAIKSAIMRAKKRSARDGGRLSTSREIFQWLPEDLIREQALMLAQGLVSGENIGDIKDKKDAFGFDGGKDVFNAWIQWVQASSDIRRVDIHQFWFLAYLYLGEDEATIAELLMIGEREIAGLREQAVGCGLLEFDSAHKQYRLTMTASYILSSLEFILKEETGVPPVKARGKRAKSKKRYFNMWDVSSGELIGQKLMITPAEFNAEKPLMITGFEPGSSGNINLGKEPFVTIERFKTGVAALRGNKRFMVAMLIRDSDGKVTVREDGLPEFFVKEGNQRVVVGVESAVHALRTRGEIVSMRSLARELGVQRPVLAGYLVENPAVKTRVEEAILPAQAVYAAMQKSGYGRRKAGAVLRGPGYGCHFDEELLVRRIKSLEAQDPKFAALCEKGRSESMKSWWGGKKLSAELEYTKFAPWIQRVQSRTSGDFSTDEFWVFVWTAAGRDDEDIMALVPCGSEQLRLCRERLDEDGLLRFGLKENRYVPTRAAIQLKQSVEFILKDYEKQDVAAIIGGHKKCGFYNIWNTDTGLLEKRVNSFPSKMLGDSVPRVITEYKPSSLGAIRLGNETIMTLEDYRLCEMSISLYPDMVLVIIVKDGEGNPVVLRSGLPLFFLKERGQRTAVGIGSALERIRARGEQVTLPGLAKELQLQKPAFASFLKSNKAWKDKIFDMVIPFPVIADALDAGRNTMPAIGTFLRERGYSVDAHLLQMRMRDFAEKGMLAGYPPMRRRRSSRQNTGESGQSPKRKKDTRILPGTSLVTMQDSPWNIIPVLPPDADSTGAPGNIGRHRPVICGPDTAHKKKRKGMVTSGQKSVLKRDAVALLTEYCLLYFKAGVITDLMNGKREAEQLYSFVQTAAVEPAEEQSIIENALDTLIHNHPESSIARFAPEGGNKGDAFEIFCRIAGIVYPGRNEKDVIAMLYKRTITVFYEDRESIKGVTVKNLAAGVLGYSPSAQVISLFRQICGRFRNGGSGGIPTDPVGIVVRAGEDSYSLRRIPSDEISRVIDAHPEREQPGGAASSDGGLAVPGGFTADAADDRSKKDLSEENLIKWMVMQSSMAISGVLRSVFTIDDILEQFSPENRTPAERNAVFAIVENLERNGVVEKRYSITDQFQTMILSGESGGFNRLIGFMKFFKEKNAGKRVTIAGIKSHPLSAQESYALKRIAEITGGSSVSLREMLEAARAGDKKYFSDRCVAGKSIRIIGEFFKEWGLMDDEVYSKDSVCRENVIRWIIEQSAVNGMFLEMDFTREDVLAHLGCAGDRKKAAEIVEQLETEKMLLCEYVSTDGFYKSLFEGTYGQLLRLRADIILYQELKGMDKIPVAEIENGRFGGIENRFWERLSVLPEGSLDFLCEILAGVKSGELGYPFSSGMVMEYFKISGKSQSKYDFMKNKLNKLNVGKITSSLGKWGLRVFDKNFEDFLKRRGILKKDTFTYHCLPDSTKKTAMSFPSTQNYVIPVLMRIIREQWEKGPFVFDEKYLKRLIPVSVFTNSRYTPGKILSVFWSEKGILEKRKGELVLDRQILATIAKKKFSCSGKKSSGPYEDFIAREFGITVAFEREETHPDSQLAGKGKGQKSDGGECDEGDVILNDIAPCLGMMKARVVNGGTVVADGGSGIGEVIGVFTVADYKESHRAAEDELIAALGAWGKDWNCVIECMRIPRIIYHANVDEIRGFVDRLCPRFAETPIIVFLTGGELFDCIFKAYGIFIVYAVFNKHRPVHIILPEEALSGDNKNRTLLDYLSFLRYMPVNSVVYRDGAVLVENLPVPREKNSIAVSLYSTIETFKHNYPSHRRNIFSLLSPDNYAAAGEIARKFSLAETEKEGIIKDFLYLSERAGYNQPEAFIGMIRLLLLNCISPALIQNAVRLYHMADRMFSIINIFTLLRTRREPQSMLGFIFLIELMEAQGKIKELRDIDAMVVHILGRQSVDKELIRALRNGNDELIKDFDPIGTPAVLAEVFDPLDGGSSERNAVGILDENAARFLAPGVDSAQGWRPVEQHKAVFCGEENVPSSCSQGMSLSLSPLSFISTGVSKVCGIYNSGTDIYL